MAFASSSLSASLCPVRSCCRKNLQSGTIPDVIFTKGKTVLCNSDVVVGVLPDGCVGGCCDVSPDNLVCAVGSFHRVFLFDVEHFKAPVFGSSAFARRVLQVNCRTTSSVVPDGDGGNLVLVELSAFLDNNELIRFRLKFSKTSGSCDVVRSTFHRIFPCTNFDGSLLSVAKFLAVDCAGDCPLATIFVGAMNGKARVLRFNNDPNGIAEEVSFLQFSRPVFAVDAIRIASCHEGARRALAVAACGLELRFTVCEEGREGAELCSWRCSTSFTFSSPSFARSWSVSVGEDEAKEYFVFVVALEDGQVGVACWRQDTVLVAGAARPCYVSMMQRHTLCRCVLFANLTVLPSSLVGGGNETGTLFFWSFGDDGGAVTNSLAIVSTTAPPCQHFSQAMKCQAKVRCLSASFLSPDLLIQSEQKNMFHCVLCVDSAWVLRILIINQQEKEEQHAATLQLASSDGALPTCVRMVGGFIVVGDERGKIHIVEFAEKKITFPLQLEQRSEPICCFSPILNKVLLLIAEEQEKVGEHSISLCVAAVSPFGRVCAVDLVSKATIFSLELYSSSNPSCTITAACLAMAPEKVVCFGWKGGKVSCVVGLCTMESEASNKETVDVVKLVWKRTETGDSSFSIYAITCRGAITMYIVLGNILIATQSHSIGLNSCSSILAVSTHLLLTQSGSWVSLFSRCSGGAFPLAIMNGVAAPRLVSAAAEEFTLLSGAAFAVAHCYDGHTVQRSFCSFFHPSLLACQILSDPFLGKDCYAVGIFRNDECFTFVGAGEESVMKVMQQKMEMTQLHCIGHYVGHTSSIFDISVFTCDNASFVASVGANETVAVWRLWQPSCELSLVARHTRRSAKKVEDENAVARYLSVATSCNYVNDHWKWIVAASTNGVVVVYKFEYNSAANTSVLSQFCEICFARPFSPVFAVCSLGSFLVAGCSNGTLGVNNFLQKAETQRKFSICCFYSCAVTCLAPLSIDESDTFAVGLDDGEVVINHLTVDVDLKWVVDCICHSTVASTPIRRIFPVNVPLRNDISLLVLEEGSMISFWNCVLRGKNKEEVKCSGQMTKHSDFPLDVCACRGLDVVRDSTDRNVWHGVVTGKGAARFTLRF